MNMTYRKAHQILNKNGLIDTIIETETRNNGENLLEVKNEIIDSIKYYLDFIKTKRFKEMKYWWGSPVNMRQRVNRAICKSLVSNHLEMNAIEVTRLEYLHKTMETIT